jgi:AraC-like DNA-binding protein
MRRYDDNICKFVTTHSEGQLCASNFVFEKRAAGCGRLQIRSTHVVYLVVSGKGRLITKETNSVLLPGTLFITFAGQEFTMENTDALTYMYISFSGTRAESLFDRLDVSPDFCVFPDYESLVTFWQSAISRASSKNLDLITESVLLYTFSQIAAFDAIGEKALINRVLHYIETEFTSPALSLSSCAEYLGYNPKYISHVFKKQAKINYSEYLRSVRIKYATVLFDSGIDSVKNVAHLSGFSDPFYFSSVFKRVIGLSPTEYIRTKRPLDESSEECSLPLESEDETN